MSLLVELFDFPAPKFAIKDTILAPGNRTAVIRGVQFQQKPMGGSTWKYLAHIEESGRSFWFCEDELQKN